jgi:hypothetical protein
MSQICDRRAIVYHSRTSATPVVVNPTAAVGVAAGAGGCNNIPRGSGGANEVDLAGRERLIGAGFGLLTEPGDSKEAD